MYNSLKNPHLLKSTQTQKQTMSEDRRGKESKRRSDVQGEVCGETV